MKRLKNYILKVASGLLPCFLPPIHIYILYKFWNKYSRKVDKRYCSCSCWDTVFKGTYESGIASYKHMYFNATGNTMKIWLVTVVCLITLYECLKCELKLLLNGHLRPLMAVLFMSSIFSHYYTWWVYINYWNDDFYLQWNHQLFFTLTEILSTSVVLHLSDSKRAITSKKIFMIISIAVIHILSGGVDQFVKNVLWGEGYAHQVLRDLAFVIPDVLHVVLPLVELLKNRKHNSQLPILQSEREQRQSVQNLTSTDPKEELRQENYKSGSRSLRMKTTMSKIREIKETFSDVDCKSSQILSKYDEVQMQLRTEISNTQWQCKGLYSQIHGTSSKKLKAEVKNQEIPSEMSLKSASLSCKTLMDYNPAGSTDRNVGRVP